jgi:CubicO group peptidase (beta-lactamase class C family)
MIDESLLADGLAYIERWVEFQQRHFRVPGVAIGVSYQGKALLARAYGLADVERAIPLTPQHVFRIASHSKMFTATAVMKLVEQGRLRLDDRLGDWLEWLPNHSGEVGRATIRQLLSHSTGLIRDSDDAGFWGFDRPFPEVSEIQELLARSEPVYPSNQRFKYSNLGYTLAGMIVEAASKASFADYIRAQILDPLGMSSTGPDLDQFSRSHLAQGYSGDGYSLNRFPLPHQGTAAMGPATGFYSTVEDLCRFGTAHTLGNPGLLSEESKREMQHPQWPIAGSDQQYGLGFMIYPLGSRLLVGHKGGFQGFITCTQIDAERCLVASALTNAIDGPAVELASGIMRIIDLALSAGRLPDHNLPRVNLDRFPGRYWSPWGVTDVVRFGSDLVAFDPAASDPTSPTTRLQLTSPDTLHITWDEGTHAPGEEVRFFFDPSDTVTQVRWAGEILRPWDGFREALASQVPSSASITATEPLSPDHAG